MKTKKKYLIIFCFTVLFLFFLKIDFRFENSVNCCGDDHDYYIHSETIALDRDLDYTNQLKGNEDKRFNVNGKIAPTGFIGTGILAAPFTFFGNFIDQILSGSDEKSTELLNYRLLFYSLSSVTYFFGSILLTKKTFEILKFDTKIYEIALVYFGSGVSYFAFERFSMSHVYEVFCASLLIYLCCKFYSSKDKNLIAFYIPIVLMLGLSVRWVNYFLLLIPIISKGFITKKTINNISLFKNNYFKLSLLISSGLFMLHTNILYGRYTINPQFVYQTSNQISNFVESSSSLINFFSVNIINIFKIFFTQEFGIFWFSPILFLSIFVLIFKFFDKNFLNLKIKFLVFLSFAQIIGIVLLWKSTASSYGFRYLYCLLPVSLILVYKFMNEGNYIFLRYYLILFSIFSATSVIFFEANLLTQLSTSEVVNSFGRTLKYSQPLYLSGLLSAFFELDSYLKIFTTSFFGAIIFKLSVLMFGRLDFINFLDNFGLPTGDERFTQFIYDVESIGIYKFLIVVVYIVIVSSLLVRSNNEK